MRISDWSSDVCSSDLVADRLVAALRDSYPAARDAEVLDVTVVPWPKATFSSRVGMSTIRPGNRTSLPNLALDRQSVASGKSVAVRVDLGGRRIIQQKRTSNTDLYHIQQPHNNS